MAGSGGCRQVRLLLDPIKLLRGEGIQITGGGRNLAEARQPAIVASKELRPHELACLIA